MNSKKISIAATFLLMSFNLLAQNNTFTLTGKLTAVSTGSKIYLVYYNPRVQKDSTTVQNGTFEFKGDLTSPVQAQLYLPHGLKK